ncbi:MAG: hypothetical protein RL323_129 [Pseudomonadota bacterium]
MTAPQTPPLAEVDTAALNGITALSHLGVIRVQGEDAAAFLQGQLTQDFALLGLSEARLAAFCSAKGRMQASFVGFKRNHQEICLICPKDVLPATLKRLSMFVLRAKAKLSDASDTLAVWGLTGKAVPEALRAGKTWAKVSDGDTDMVRLPDAMGVLRAYACGPKEAALEANLPIALWQWLDVNSGVVLVTAPVVDAFVPQMLNYESVGGVNFKKGCYPGQEVVARSQYRGILKRRAYLTHSEQPLQPGQELFHPSDAEQPCGTVVAVAPHPHSGFDALVSVQNSAVDEQPITVGSSSGSALTFKPLPYELLADI